tara:strand:- start:630 stop:1385 length:756 start_codon:yes stop_codon:yes gene_type:complete
MSQPNDEVLPLIKLNPYIKKTCICCYNPKLVNMDMLWKQNVMLKFILVNNLKPKNLLDIGAGEMSISAYCIKNYDCEYTAVDLEGVSKNNFFKLLKNNNISTEKVDYQIVDFLEFKTNKKFDLIIDGCAMIHFKPTKKESANDGLLYCGRKIKNVLSDNGYFLFTGDCLKSNLKNHRGEKNIEYITKEQIIECFEKSGLNYLKEFTHFLSRDNINNSHSVLDFSTINKGWKAFDFRHRDHYDRVFLVFKKN